MKMRIIIRCVALGAALGSVVRGADAWYPGWDYRQKITVTSAAVGGSGVLTNFPVLVTENNVGAALWQHAQSNGVDLVFTAADGVTRLAYDIELYDKANTRLCAWVKVPELAGATDTSFYVYYGQPGTTSLAAGSGVWSDYRAVWHLRETSGTRYDSTTNGANLTANGAVSFSASGKIDGACSGFDGVNPAYLSASKPVVNGNGTISAWVKMPGTLSNGRAIIDANYATGVMIREYSGVGNVNTLEAWVRNAPIITDTTYFTGTENAWVCVTLVLSNGTAYLYRNGQYCASGTYSGTPSNSGASYLATLSSGIHKWSGSMDETRACREVRSGDWIATEYANQNAPASFSSAASEEKAPATAAAWYGGWGYRQQLFVDPAQVSGSLSNFPALVTERNMRSNVWLNATSDGSDILFTAGDGVTMLAHEMEKFDAANKQLCAWVKLPLVSAASNTAFYIYYGRPGAANQANPAGVWTGYRAVWHLKETSGTRYDSTSTDADLTANGAVSFSASGKIDGACSGFDGINTAYLQANKRVINGSGTVSAWVKMPSSLSNGHAIFDTGNDDGTLIRQNGNGGNGLEVFVNSGGVTITDTLFFQGMENAWIYVTLVMNNGMAYVYRNGAVRTSNSYGSTPVGPAWAYLGVWNNGTHKWNGMIDETRVAVDALSANWIVTEYRNQANPSAFVFASAEEVHVPQGTLMLLR